MKVARIYLRVSTKHQSLERQNKITEDAKANGYYIAKVYAEKTSGAVAERPQLNALIQDLQPGDVVIAEKLDRISRLPLPEAEKIIAAIKAKKARISVPEVINLDELSTENKTAQIVMQAMQELLLKVALQAARDDYETRRKRQREGIEIARRKGKYKGRRANLALRERIIELRAKKVSISRTAKLCECSISQVKIVWRLYKLQKADSPQLDFFERPSSEN